MSGYLGEEAFSRVSVDGERIFTEALRKQATFVLKTGVPDPELNIELRLLARQDPHPSHQAAYYLGRLAERGLGLIPGYDEAMSNAWRLEPLFPHLVQLDLASSGITYELVGDAH